ncbi:MAG: T9SS type A sorting domain-containing protein [Ignavibacteria bacterium]|nr:T9SS type A sorting domain-containing protein [Ignavibacteria bacterium]
MRRILLLIVAFVSFAIVEKASGQILMTENFDYPEGDSLGAHGWVSFSGGNTNVLNVATPGLTYSGYPLSGIGNSAFLQRNGQDAYKQFAGTGDSTGNIYISFMLRMDSAGTGDHIFGLLPDNSTTNFAGRIYIKDTTGGYRIGIGKSTNPIVYSSSVYTFGTTYVAVIKWVFVDGASNDEVNLFVFNSTIPGTEPAPTVGPVTQNIGDPPNIRRVYLRQGAGNLGAYSSYIDGIRVFKTWGNLVSVSNISTVAENFSLSQNYPNPFNPSTKINFSIPERSFVTMKVYDMLGKEVMTLVNSNYSAGTYAVDMNASALSTGIYMYSVEARTESGNILKDTKKLTLVK